MQAIVQYFSQKLGRIRDLMHELDSLALDFPCLSRVDYLKDAVLRLSFLDLESETKFSIYLRGGGLMSNHSSLSCPPTTSGDPYMLKACRLDTM